MQARIKTFFTENLGIKALALIFASVLWIIVVNVDDPVQTKTFTSSVQILNADVLLEQSKYYTLDSNTISFRISAKRSILEKLSGSDFYVSADMNDLENDSRIPVDITPTKYASQITMTTSTHYLYVNIGTNVSKRFTIDVIANGQPATGYVLSNLSCTPGTITIEGPEEIMSEVSAVKAIVDVTDLAAGFSIETIPVLYDSQGNTVDTTNITMSSTSLLVSADIKATKTVPITATYGGSASDGYYVEKVSVDPSSVTIAGDAAAINSVQSIEIPGTAIDLGNATESFDTTVDITAYLPDGVELVDDASSKVTVKVTVVPLTQDNANTAGTDESDESDGSDETDEQGEQP